MFHLISSHIHKHQYRAQHIVQVTELTLKNQDNKIIHKNIIYNLDILILEKKGEKLEINNKYRN